LGDFYLLPIRSGRDYRNRSTDQRGDEMTQKIAELTLERDRLNNVVAILKADVDMLNARIARLQPETPTSGSDGR
jgi:hypothetical protein